MKRFLLISSFLIFISSNVHAIQYQNQPPENPQITGHKKVEVGKYYLFNATSIDPEGDNELWYRFDWGDEITEWQQSSDFYHSWIKPSKAIIKAQAKDNKGALSEWSIAFIVDIFKINQTPLKPIVIGNTNSFIKNNIIFQAKSIDPEGDHLADKLQYQFNWGDNTKSKWINSQSQWATYSHCWEQPGQYCVTVISKDSINATSEQSDCKFISVTGPNQLPESLYISGPTIGYVNQSYSFKVHAKDDDQDALEYSLIMYLQDQTYTSNWQSSPDFSWSWNMPGTFCIKAAVRDNPGRNPVFSKCHDIAILKEELPCYVSIECPNPDNERCHNLCNGGYVFSDKGKLRIAWRDLDGINENSVQRVDSYYSIKNSEWQFIDTDTFPNGDYDEIGWQIPSNFFHERVRVKVIAQYNTGCVSEAISKPIKLLDSQKPEITILQPESGIYYVGEPVPVSWQVKCPDGFDIKRIDIKFHSNGTNQGTLVYLSNQDTKKNFYSWKPRQSHVTDNGQIKLVVWCTNCTFEENISNTTFKVKFRHDPSNPWIEAQRPFEIPNPSNYQLPSMLEPDIFVDANDNIHLITSYIGSTDNQIPALGEAQLYYKKMNSGIWSGLEKATSYNVWQSQDNNVAHLKYELRNPKITSDSNNIPHVVYEFESYNTHKDIYYIAKKNSSWTKPINLSDNPGDMSHNARILVDQNQNVYVFWHESHFGIYFRILSHGEWSSIQKVPSIYEDFDISVGLNNIIHIVGHDNDSIPFYLSFDGNTFSQPQQISSFFLGSRPDIIETPENIKVISGLDFNIFTRSMKEWKQESYQFSEKHVIGIFMCQDQNNRIHTIYKGYHEGNDRIMERIDMGNVWSDYNVISPYRADHYYAAHSNNKIMGVTWESAFEGKDAVYVSYADYSNVMIGPVIRNYSVDPVSGDLPLLVNFEADIIKGTEDIAKIQIQFGDGQYASGNTFYTHLYEYPGTYDTYIQVVDKSGNTVFQEKQILVLAPAYYNVRLSIFPQNGGNINGDLNCSNMCQSSIRENKTIHLSQQPNNGYVFSHWTGCDLLNENICTNTIHKELDITANFICLLTDSPQIIIQKENKIQSSQNYSIEWMSVPHAVSYTIEESLTPDFSSIISTNVTLNTIMTYSHIVQQNTPHYYRVKAASVCNTSMWSLPAKIIIFLPKYTLHIQSEPENAGTVLDQKVNHDIYCPQSQCNSEYYKGSVVRLKASSFPEYQVNKWVGCDNLQNNMCMITIDSDRQVHLSFKCEDIESPIINASNTVIKANEKFIVYWSTISGAVHYQIQESVNTAFSEIIYSSNTVEISKDFIKQQINMPEYYYRVRAFRSCGSISEWSNTIRVVKYNGSLQQIPLERGWNWISLNTKPQNEVWEINSILSKIYSHGIKIVSQQGYSEYDNQWYGTLMNLKPAELYMLHMQIPDILTIDGIKISNDYEIGLNKGWNWIGFLPEIEMSINHALNNIGNNAIKIVGQRGYAEFYNGWWGTLDYFEPAKGYMLKLNNPDSLKYPNKTNKSKIINHNNKTLPTLIHDWTVNQKDYEFQGNITAIITNSNNEPISLTNNDWVGAFVNNQCRGAVNAIQTPKGILFFIQVWSNSINLPISFKYYQSEENKVYPIQLKEQITFIPNMELGSIVDPFEFRLMDIHGDVNRDGKVDLRDVILIIKHIMRLHD